MHPPPNISGSLTIGHCLQLSLEDTLVRWRRMQGYNTLFQPGYDHAGISTWASIGRTLAQEGKSQRDLGREGFDAYVQEWLERYGGTIMSQFRQLGASLDYRRTRFTMDEGYYRAVMRWFVHLYERGFIYRANRIVNWCPKDKTALSDLEVEHEDEDDTLSYIRYPLADGSGHVTIATVRPATILADVAVAVHPEDERYRDLVGKEVLVPFVERRVPVIADERVEREFGTGALKVTPGHDPTDFEIGRDHDLPELAVIGPDGLMTDAAGELAGQSQEDAGRAVLDWASERGQLEKREHYRHSVGHCERCGTRIEPLIVPQWWLAMEELAAPAIASVKEGRVRFTPERFARVYLDWMENVRDWCISRQIWWGQRIPVWYCPDGHVTVTESEPEACAECGSPELRQEEDVLDTWFSSALYPYATLGWPDETPELARYYPGSVVATAREIIFLWIARMIFSGLELIGKDPYSDVLIHSTLLNPEGKRMSRTMGTGIDPEDVLEPYGADATRYGLLRVTSSQDPRFSYGTIEEGRKLANKLWNASRLLLMAGSAQPALKPDSVEERWILARIDATRAELEDDLSRFDFAHGVERLYHLTFDDFCDWYLESIKPRLGEEDVRATALAALERLLKLLHPVIPHVTEEIWTSLPARETRLIVAPWPEPQTEFAADLHALDEAQTAARLYRRSGVRTELAGDSLRIFEAVVRPSGDGQGDIEAERARVQKEIERAEKMLANEKFVANAAPEAVEGERQKLAQYLAERDALG
jgi:valyl-tRNA synthetase